MKKKILFVFGTRPEAIKMAPLVKYFQAEEAFDTKVVVTAQHREMLDQVLELFALTPDHDLNLMKAGQSLSDITSGVLKGLETVIGEEKPDLVLVHGDTTTTFGGALAAFYQQVPVAHIEAGLRSGNMKSPFPEEANRRLTGVLTELHFSPTIAAAENLRREGVAEEQIFITGNTVIDALQSTVSKDYVFDEPALQEFLARAGKKVLLTTHRRENQGKPMEEIFAAVKELAEKHPDLQFIFPVHKNPKIRKMAAEHLGDLEQVLRIEPLDYAPFVNLISRVDLVLTDSGGLQEEAPSLGKPVLVLRENTERPEAVTAGTVKLVGSNREKIVSEVNRLLTDEAAYKEMERAINPYGDGHACARICAGVKYYFGLSERPENWKI